MALETGDFIGDLSPDDPPPSDPKSQGDDHLRLIKKTVQQSFAGFDGAVMVYGAEAQGGTANEFNVTVDAPVTYDNPFIVVFQATHTHPSHPTIQINGLGYRNLQSFDATNVGGSAIREGAIVAALWNGTVFRIISAVEAARRGGETYSNTHNFASATLIAPTPSANNHATTKLYVDTTVAASASTKVSKAGDTYTGSHDAAGATSFTVPDRSLGDNSSNAANTRYVDQTAFSAALPNQSGHAGETLITDGTDASWGHDATRANKAGDTYTGTHDFSSATTVRVPTVGISTYSTTAASTAFVKDQPNWDVTDITTATYTLPSNRRGEMYVCGGSTTTVTLPAPSARYFARVHNPNPAAVTISAGTGRTINGGASIVLQPGSSVTVTRDGSTSNYRAFFFNVGGGGGGGLPYDTYQDFLTSGTFTVQKTGWHRITAIGAGGSGGRRAVSNTDNNARYAAGGGGAGGTCVKEVMLTQGVAYTVVIGAGGASLSSDATGNAGGSTTVSGSGVSMTANGGGGGATDGSTSTAIALSAFGGTGGTASGGDFNYTGGDGGWAQVSSDFGQAAAAGGGGAPSIFGTRPSGGDAYAYPGPGGAQSGAAGGGASAGGGGHPSNLGGAPAGSVTPTPPSNSTRGIADHLGTDWRTGYPVRGNTPTIGDNRGYGSNGSNTSTPSGNAQAFAGSGGACRSFGVTGGPSSGAGGLGGGSGGTAGRLTPSGSTGAGGNGFALFEWIA